MRRWKNAFIIRGPVPSELFFDRRREIDYFVRALENDRYDLLIAILAPFKFGKSSLLLKYENIAKRFERVIPLFLRMNVIERPIRFILRRLEDFIPKKYYSDLNEIYAGVVGGEREPWDFFEKLNQSLSDVNKWLLLLIDEFHELGKKIIRESFLRAENTKEVFEFLKGVTETSRIGLIVGGSLVGAIKESIKVWGGRFLIFHLREFEREESLRMLRTLFKLSEFEITDEKIEYIAHVANDHPYYMQLFGYNLVNLRRSDESAIEYVREILQTFFIDYYDSKIIELTGLESDILRILYKISQGATIKDFPQEELETILKLEYSGIIYRDNSHIVYYDKNFQRYIINTVSGRLQEKFLPTYTPEYIIARKLAYEENFKQISVSYMSWGAFDILIPQKINDHWGIGIQVKMTTKDQLYLVPEEINRIHHEAKKLNVIPVIAVYFAHKNQIRYYPPKQKIIHKEGSEKIKALLQIKNNDIKNYPTTH